MANKTERENLPTMAPPPTTVPFQIPGALITRLRKEKGMTAKDLANLVGTKQQTIDKIEKGVIKYSRYFLGITEALGITPEMIGRNLPKGLLESGGLPLATDNDLPLYVVVGRVKEHVFRRRNCPVSKILRPPHMLGNEDYGIVMPDDSMSPEFRAGDTVCASPDREPEPGAAHVFINKRNIEFFTVATLIEIQKDEGEYVIRRHNPLDHGGGKLVMMDWDAHLVLGRYRNYEPGAPVAKSQNVKAKTV